MLVKLGDLDGAREVFELMLTQEHRGTRARGHRSLALLDMYQGRYRDARRGLEEAVLLNRSAKHLLSEMRDRMYLATVCKSLGMQAEFAEQVDAARRLQGEVRLSPSWLFPVGRALAEMGRVAPSALSGPGIGQ